MKKLYMQEDAKMKSNRINKAIMQWLLPVGVLLLIIVLLLLRFSVMGKQREKEKVAKMLIAQVQTYAVHVDKMLNGIQKSADTATAYIAREPGEDYSTMMEAICDASGVYDVVICTEDGKGYRMNGEAADISGTEYFAKIFTGEKKMIYTTNDGLNQRAAIVVVSPVIQQLNVTQYVICYYDDDGFNKLVQRWKFDINTFFVLLEKNAGRVIAVGGDSNYKLDEPVEDYFLYLQQEGDDSKSVERMQARIQNGISDITYLAYREQEYGFVYAPVDSEQFYLMVAIGQEYIDQAVEREWAASGSATWQLVVTLLLFVGIMVVFNIIARVKEHEKSRKLANKADTDLLTDLYNKVATERKIRQYLLEHPNEQGVLFVLDIDNFKKINDTMGHVFGDEVLRSLGVRIRSEFRDTDIIGRTGGDEFTIFLCNMKDEAIIREEAYRVERFFRGFQTGEYVKYSATASIGAAVYPRDARDFEGLYKAADHALYVAKKRGKNQLAFYGEDK